LQSFVDVYKYIRFLVKAYFPVLPSSNLFTNAHNTKCKDKPQKIHIIDSFSIDFIGRIPRWKLWTKLLLQPQFFSIPKLLDPSSSTTKYSWSSGWHRLLYYRKKSRFVILVYIQFFFICFCTCAKLLFLSLCLCLTDFLGMGFFWGDQVYKILLKWHFFNTKIILVQSKHQM
jgi:hypothetical protein